MQTNTEETIISNLTELCENKGNTFKCNKLIYNFLKNQIDKEYEKNLSSALSDVKSGTHLKHVTRSYRTREVCLEAVKYESGNEVVMFKEIHAIPIPNLKYVVECMREFKKHDKEYLEQLEKDYQELSNSAAINATFDKIKTFFGQSPATLDDDYDGMLKKMHNESYIKLLEKQV